MLFAYAKKLRLSVPRCPEHMNLSDHGKAVTVFPCLSLKLLFSKSNVFFFWSANRQMDPGLFGKIYNIKAVRTFTIFAKCVIVVTETFGLRMRQNIRTGECYEYCRL